MKLAVVAAAVRALMSSLVPEADHSWTREPLAVTEARYDDIADGIAFVAVTEEPLPDLDELRTGLVLGNVAALESFFRADVVACRVRGLGGAWGLYQFESPRYRAEACASVESATRRALTMLRESFVACRHRPIADRASWFTDGPRYGCPSPWPRSRVRVQPALKFLVFVEGEI